MKEIDITQVGYDVELITEDGTHYLLNDALQSLEWEDQKNEIAQRATITVGNMAMGNTWLMAIAKINCLIRIYGRWGEGRQLLFDGAIWEWQYVSATDKELTIIAYDNMKRLQQSQDIQYYSAGMATQAIIADICGKWGIPLDYKWSQNLMHEKKAFSGENISDMIIDLLEEVRKKTGEKYVIRFQDGNLQILDYGTNATVYKFDSNNTISTNDKININNLVTRVKVIGKEDGEGRASVDAIVDGDTQFGVLQEILRRDTDKSVQAARDVANTLIAEKGKPEEVIQIKVPDLPFMRKGDRVDVEAGNLIGFFYVEGVSHSGTTRQMTLNLARG